MRIRHIAVVVAVVSLLLGGLMAGVPRARAADAGAEACFTATGQCIRGRFLAYWQAHGGLAINGFPLTGERLETLEDGKQYTVQYFERVRMEYHPEFAGTPYEVELGQFGRRALADAVERSQTTSGYQGAVDPVAPAPGATYFPKTGHNLGGRFLAYWQANGGLAQFGYPIAEEGHELLGPLDPVTHVATPIPVQYFERVRMEYHPEFAGMPYEVELGQFGRQMLGWNALLSGSLGLLYLTNQTVQMRLGAPITPVAQVPGATQAFEHGLMIWRGDQRQIYVFCGSQQSGRVETDFATGQLYFQDTWTEGQEPGGGPAPQPGLFYPQRGFGKVWRENDYVRQCLGYALTAKETGYSLSGQVFGGGVMLSAPGNHIYVVASQYFRAGPSANYERFDAPPQ
ncbi:MAG TPA: hypothetical protein VFW96_00275 [Thermomicrobiales bacterium]|nr:hypothetical protein [Thermomicrobiales bacterium]